MTQWAYAIKDLKAVNGLDSIVAEGIRSAHLLCPFTTSATAIVCATGRSIYFVSEQGGSP